MVIFVKGDIFATKCQTIVNPVNTKGVMESGLAYAVRKKYPGSVFGYTHACDNGTLEPGKLILWKGQNRWVLHFPTRIDWWQPSRISYIEDGLQKFVKCYKAKGITSAAFPLLGCGKGKLSEAEVKPLLEKYLKPLDITCEVYIPKEKKE